MLSNNKTDKEKQQSKVKSIIPEEFLADFRQKMTDNLADDQEILVKLQKLSLQGRNMGE